MDKVPAGRFGEPEEIAEVALYLATTTAAFLMGQDIVVDGGYIIP
jgi:3-oxoacyl-[acyl-carrier protein] reductase